MTMHQEHFHTSTVADRLRRSHRRSNAMLFGVCADTANFFSFDTTLVRLSALLLLWLFTLPSLVLYLLIAILAESR